MVRLAVGLLAGLALAPLVIQLLRRSAGVSLTNWSVIATAVAVSAAGVAVVFWTSVAIAFGVAFVVLGIPAAVADAIEHRIPDRFSLPLCGALVVAVVAAAIVREDVGSGFRALLGGVAWGAVLLLSYLITGQPGPGDVKLAPSVGMLLGWFGWTWAIGGFLTMYLLTAVAGLVGVLLRRYSFRNGQVPMGPSMIMVAFVGGTLAQL